MKNNHTPEIRFPGFTGKWEQRKFKDFISKAGKKNTMDENYLAYSVSNKLGLVSQSVQFDGSRLDDLDKTSYKLVNPNEFAYNPARINVGSIAFNNLNKTVIVSSLYVVLKMSEKLDNEFILQFIKSQLFIDEVRRNTEGSVREYLFFENFKNIKFPYTSNKDEQATIGNFFKQLDDTIALHQQELTTLKQTKQGFLQKMFPKEGKSVPEIRFPGFKEEWEQRMLGEVVNVTMGQSPYGENYTKNPDDYILVQGNADIKNGWVAPRVWTTQVTKSADKGDIILSVRAPVGDVGRTQYDVVLGRGVAGIKGNEFIFQLLCKMKSNGFWTRYSTGSTFESINSNDLKEAIISIPEEAEQTKIGNFFKQLDDTIALHQRELDALKETRKAFLQKMFV